MNTLPTIAIVGCGRVAPRHFDSLPGRFRLVAVCDVDPDARARASQAYDAPGYASLEAMFAEETPDVVALATPSGLHPEQAILCAQRGVHVITEKPMAIRWQDAQRMVHAFEAHGVRLFEVKQNRFSPQWMYLKKVLSEGALGRVHSIQANLFWARPQAYYDLAAWRGTWEMDGGALMNQAIHHVDVVRWLFGPVESVQAMSATLARRIEVEDTAAIQMRFRSGAIGSMHVSMLAPNKNFEASLTVIAEKGLIRLGGELCDQVLTWDADIERPAEVGAAESPYGNGHPLFYQDVYEALTEGRRGLLEGREGLKALEIIIAAYRSASEGRRISLPLEDTL